MYAAKEISSSITAESFDATTVCYIADTTSGNITINLESAAVRAGQSYVIKHSSGANTLTVQPSNGELIDGSGSWTSAGPGDSLNVVSDSSGWLEIGTGAGGADTANALEDSVYGTTLTLTSYNSDQTLTPSDGVLNLFNSDGNEYLLMGRSNSYQGPSNENLMTFYKNDGTDVWQWTADVGHLIDGNEAAQFEITSALDHTGGDDIIRQMFRMSGNVGDIPGTNPAWFIQAEKIDTIDETAEIIALAKDTTGGPAIRMNVYSTDTNSPQGNFKISCDLFNAGVGALECTLLYDIQDVAGNSFEMFLEETGTFACNQIGAHDDTGGVTGVTAFTNATDTPTTDPGWTSSSTVDMNAPDGYIKAYVGAQAVTIPYWNT